MKAEIEYLKIKRKKNNQIKDLDNKNKNPFKTIKKNKKKTNSIKKIKNYSKEKTIISNKNPKGKRKLSQINNINSANEEDKQENLDTLSVEKSDDQIEPIKKRGRKKIIKSVIKEKNINPLKKEEFIGRIKKKKSDLVFQKIPYSKEKEYSRNIKIQEKKTNEKEELIFHDPNLSKFNLEENENADKISFKFSINRPEKQEHEKTLLDFLNDSKSGIPMKASDIEKINNISNSGVSKEKSKKSSVTLSCSNLSEMMVNNLERETYKYLKPKVIFDSNGNIKIEKPNYNEIAQKIQDENFKKNFPYVIHNNEKTKLTSSSFRKSVHSDKWTEKETDLFYQALSLFGCNFSYLEIILTPRTRDQIKKKFSREERFNKEKIEQALKKNIINRKNSIDESIDVENDNENKYYLLKFANIVKNFKQEIKQSEKNKRGKYSKNIQDSDITLSNYDNTDSVDNYLGNKGRRDGARKKFFRNIEKNINEKNEICQKGKKYNLKKNIDNEYCKILNEKENKTGQYLNRKLENLLNELEEKSQNSYESDDDSIQREKDRIQNIKISNLTKKESIPMIIKEINLEKNIKNAEIIIEKSSLFENNTDKIKSLNKNKVNLNLEENNNKEEFDFLSNFK